MMPVCSVASATPVMDSKTAATNFNGPFFEHQPVEGIPDVIKKEIHDLVCKELEKTDVEEEVVAAVCTKVHASIPSVPEELCTLGVSHEWDSLKSGCTAIRLKGIPDVIKKEIHDLVCKELEKTDVEEEVVAAVCTKVHASIPSVPEEL